MKCVFYALVLGLCCQSIAPAQSGYGRSGGRQSFSSMVDRLSQDTAPAQPSTLPGNERSNFGQQGVGESSRLRVAQDEVVALRPQPMSVRQTSYETAPVDSQFAPRNDTPSRRALDRLNAEEHLQSFIERESTTGPAEDKINPAELISRIGMNLMFVLALAVGGILMFKQFQKAKTGGGSATPEGLAGLKIDQVLQVSRGVSLYLIDSSSSKVLVAVDAGGIKSVNVLPPRFEDELEQPESFAAALETQREEPQRPAEPKRKQEAGRAARRRLDETSSSEIDQNLIKLLLSKSKQAA